MWYIELILPKKENKARISILITSIHHCTGNTNSTNEKERKKILKMGKKKYKPRLFTDDMSVYVYQDHRAMVSKYKSLFYFSMWETKTWKIKFTNTIYNQRTWKT